MTVEVIAFNNQKDRERFCSMLSLCRRAGKLASGETACEAAIKSKKAKLVLLSGNASGNTTKKFTNSSEYYKVPIFRLEFTSERLGQIIGEAKRSVIAITGGDFAEQLIVYAERLDGKA